MATVRRKSAVLFWGDRSSNLFFMRFHTKYKSPPKPARLHFTRGGNGEPERNSSETHHLFGYSATNHRKKSLKPVHFNQTQKEGANLSVF
ncbi:unnamed protein product [Protopolystoma xenopodis]|uniref:Uncharacterized protein n=1 Tax=Protopolystoma xenopodis TaxID=117903 RepID=A0A448WD16_9PLAT|nr:unnamed protein product [Protopolystoma xenopodis]